ncbi:MEDS domain-containing protein [Streptomyces sp. V4I2]|uniref:MEDS domain-containing protein n=1 Tax=Streptomyces sp. V4I2 TaxID=3042280 RepID=UPI00277EE13A|nr:MEDS domain-containing protein [Streptomyces sp. V4I2]MDQ1048240.1 hypothetical protein [Streptomyces sp. V4I2]
MTPEPAPTPHPFDHRMTVFGADDDFLATALPFLTEGLTATNEPPPVAIAAPDKLDLLHNALGPDAKNVALVPHTDWYTGSAANAIAQGAGYLAAHAAPAGRIHLLMEPVWNGRAGRSPRESAEWIRYEALANLLFAPFATTALCAYDTRTAGPAIIDAARRTHPGTGAYEDPARIAHAPVGRGPVLRLRTAHGPPRRRPPRRLRPAAHRRARPRTGTVVRPPGVRVRRRPRRGRRVDGPPPVRVAVPTQPRSRTHGISRTGTESGSPPRA